MTTTVGKFLFVRDCRFADKIVTLKFAAFSDLYYVPVHSPNSTRTRRLFRLMPDASTVLSAFTMTSPLNYEQPNQKLWLWSSYCPLFLLSYCHLPFHGHLTLQGPVHKGRVIWRGHLSLLNYNGNITTCS